MPSVSVPVIGASALAAGSIGSALIGAGAAHSAADAQVASAANTLDFQRGVYGDTTQRLASFTGTGTNALYSLASLYGLPTTAGGASTASGASGSPAAAAFNDFTQLPSYQFPLQQGQQATTRALAASGLLNSGGAAKALTQYGQGYASTGFNNYLAALTNLANLGQNSAVNTGQQGNVAAGTIGNANNVIGGASASGIVGGANAINGGINNLTGLLTSPSAYSSLGGTGGESLLSNLFSSGGGGASPIPVDASALNAGGTGMFGLLGSV